MNSVKFLISRAYFFFESESCLWLWLGSSKVVPIFFKIQICVILVRVTGQKFFHTNSCQKATESTINTEKKFPPRKFLMPTKFAEFFCFIFQIRFLEKCNFTFRSINANTKGHRNLLLCYFCSDWTVQGAVVKVNFIFQSPVFQRTHSLL